MSASSEKKRRREERAEGIEKRQIQKTVSAKAKTRRRIIRAAVSTFAVILVVVLVVFNSTLFYTGVNAVNIGNWGFKTAEFNYFYKTALYTTYSAIVEAYGDYASLFIDTSKPLKDQNSIYADMSWDQYFENEAIDRMSRLAKLNAEAANESFTLTDEARAEVDASISAARSDAEQYGYGSLDNYLASIYSKGMTEKLYRSLIEKEAIAKNYSELLLSRLSFSEEQLDERYKQNETDYNLITFYVYFVSGAANDEEGITADIAMNAAYQTATAISAARTEDIFADIVYEYAPESEKETYADPNATRRLNVSPTNISTTYKDWLVSADRQYGDTTIIEGDSGYYVLLYVESNDNSYDLQSFRHILAKAAVDPDFETITPATVAEAEDRAKELYELWQEDPTVEHFADIANESSEDTGSNTNGGLYENIQMGYLVPEIEEWLFDPERQYGDTDTIYVKSTNYSGYHIVWYEGSGNRYDHQIAENLLKEEWFNAWLEERDPDYQVKMGIAFQFAK